MSNRVNIHYQTGAVTLKNIAVKENIKIGGTLISLNEGNLFGFGSPIDTGIIAYGTGQFGIPGGIAESPRLEISGGGSLNTKTTLLASQTINRVLTLPDITDTLVTLSTVDNLTNKTMDSNTNSITSKFLFVDGGNASVDVYSGGVPNGGFVLTATSATTAEWLIPSSFFTGAIRSLQTGQFGPPAGIITSPSVIISGGGTNLTSTTLLGSQTADRILTLPDISDTLVTVSSSDSLTNKTITDSTNNVTASSLFSSSGLNTIDVTSSANPVTNQVLTATSDTTATWQLPPTISYLGYAYVFGVSNSPTGLPDYPANIPTNNAIPFPQTASLSGSIARNDVASLVLNDVGLYFIFCALYNTNNTTLALFEDNGGGYTEVVNARKSGIVGSFSYNTLYQCSIAGTKIAIYNMNVFDFAPASLTQPATEVCFSLSVVRIV